MKSSIPQRSVGWGEVLPGLGTDYKVWGAPPSTPGRRLAWGEGL